MLKNKRKVIISLHGINTDGAWQKHVAPLISEQGWVYYPLHYGNFSPFQFVRGSEREEKIDWFRDEFNSIKQHIEPIMPSMIAHSFGTFIVCNALDKFKHIRLDKLILCGSIVPPEYEWRKIIERKQVTTVKNDCGGKDFWAGISGKFVEGTGPSGRTGFAQKHERLLDNHFERFEHSDFFGQDHYRGEWIPFLERDIPYLGETEPPAEHEEPVSPIEAARWSALTYYKQFISRAVAAIRDNKMFPIIKSSNSDDKSLMRREPIVARGLMVAIPSTPGGAKDGAIKDFSAKLGLQDVNFGDTPRTIKVGTDGWLYDVPTVLQTLSCLDHRKDSELGPAILEFQRMLERLLDSPHADERDFVKTEWVSKLIAR